VSKDLQHIQVSVTQKETPVLYLLQQTFGGKVSKYGKQNCHKWRVHAVPEMLNFLRAVQPYAFIKLGEIKIAIQFLEGMRPGGKGCHPLTPDEVLRREGLYSDFRLERDGHKKS
jgi:hypothetical protein